MGTQCEIHFYSTVSAGFSNTFLRETVCVFHFEVLMMAEEGKVHCAHLGRRWLILYSALTLPCCGYRAMICS